MIVLIDISKPDILCDIMFWDKDTSRVVQIGDRQAWMNWEEFKKDAEVYSDPQDKKFFIANGKWYEVEDFKNACPSRWFTEVKE